MDSSNVRHLRFARIYANSTTNPRFRNGVRRLCVVNDFSQRSNLPKHTMRQTPEESRSCVCKTSGFFGESRSSRHDYLACSQWKRQIDVKQALQMASAIQGRYLPNVRMARLLFIDAYRRTIEGFEAYQNKRIDVLLCTTIIEDTPTVGNSTMIIVEKADYSDVMRLHRLRGHLSNSHYPSECVYVLSDDANDDAISTVERCVMNLMDSSWQNGCR